MLIKANKKSIQETMNSFK